MLRLSRLRKRSCSWVQISKMLPADCSNTVNDKINALFINNLQLIFMGFLYKQFAQKIACLSKTHKFFWYKLEVTSSSINAIKDVIYLFKAKFIYNFSFVTSGGHFQIKKQHTMPNLFKSKKQYKKYCKLLNQV